VGTQAGIFKGRKNGNVIYLERTDGSAYHVVQQRMSREVGKWICTPSGKR
jgi:hypothetical protein